MKTLNVNESACIACGACIAIDPEHFDFNDEGLSQVINQENLDSESVITAVESCPTNAISLTGECNNENCECENCHCDNCDCSEDNCNCENCDDEVKE